MEGSMPKQHGDPVTQAFDTHIECPDSTLTGLAKLSPRAILAVQLVEMGAIRQIHHR